MKICFVQPDTDYQIEKNRHALALTFPQLISDLCIEKSNYCIYIAGKSKLSFSVFLEKLQPTHVFITAITSTFPYAVEFAKEAKKFNSITVLGGLFASINYTTITNNYSCFDYVVAGHPNPSLLLQIQALPSKPKFIVFDCVSNYKKPLGNIITDERFREIYSANDTVCYELANGCNYNCSFCTMRKAFPNHIIQKRDIDIIRQDIATLSLYWEKIKLIDDDISISLHNLCELDLTRFKEVIAETRLDNITEKNMKIFRKVGVTHLIVGVESFDVSFLKYSSKTLSPESWYSKIKRAAWLCVKYNIIIRPVVMITNITSTIDNLLQYKEIMSDWTPENNIELLCSFYTPHPGMATQIEYKKLLTFNLKYYDHLHCVWIPPLIGNENLNQLCDIYNEIVFTTKSSDYNPEINLNFDKGFNYMCFFDDISI